MLPNLPNKQIENTERTTLAVFVNVLFLSQWQWPVHTMRRHLPTSPVTITRNGKTVNTLYKNKLQSIHNFVSQHTNRYSILPCLIIASRRPGEISVCTS